MPKRLWPRLALSFVGVAAGSVLLFAVLANLVLGNRFAGYVRENLELRSDQLAAALVAAYERDGGWNRVSLMQLMHVSTMEGLRLTLTGPEGNLIFSGDQFQHMPMMDPTHPGSGPAAPRSAAGAAFAVTRNLTLNGRPLGTLHVDAGDRAGAMSQRDLEFVRDLNRLLGLAAVGSVALAILASLLLARNLSAPLAAMTAVARQMRRGNLAARVPPGGAEELEQLGQSLNHLAESLQQQERLRKNLTADVAHELRTPLASVRSHLEAFVDGVWEPTQERLRVCHDQAMRLVRLVGDLERLSAAEGEALRLDYEEVKLAEPVGNAVTSFERLFRDKGIELASPVEPRDCTLSVDRDKLGQVLGNLLANALKYTPAGGRVEVGYGCDRDQATVWVTDSGPGIPAEELPFIFERFYRGDKSRARATGGAGIGLAIVKALVDAHGGRVEVQSQPGRGTRFTVRLPRRQRERVGEGPSR